MFLTDAARSRHVVWCLSNEVYCRCLLYVGRGRSAVMHCPPQSFIRCQDHWCAVCSVHRAPPAGCQILSSPVFVLTAPLMYCT